MKSQFDFENLQNVRKIWIAIDCINEHVTSIVLQYAYVLETRGGRREMKFKPQQNSNVREEIRENTSGGFSMKL